MTGICHSDLFGQAVPCGRPVQKALWHGQS
nr:MAG TPA: hypothetical protein [Caudoviricetes sp.]